MNRVFVVTIIAVFMLGSLAIMGCGGGQEELTGDSSAYAGTYTSEADPGDYIEIRENNTFTMVIGGELTSGSCALDNGRLLLSAGSFSDSMEISEGVIVDSSGTKFLK